jgi:hypothetical protein
LAEITEYTLAVLVSTLLVGGSAVAYSAFARFEASSEVDASLSALVGLANDAVVNGHSSSTLLLPSSTLTCEHRVLTITSGNDTASSPIGGDCDFVMGISGGTHTISFDGRPSGLSLEVT